MYTESNIRVDESVSVTLESYCDIFTEKTVQQFCWGTYTELKIRAVPVQYQKCLNCIDINEK